jgi:hypothetical protein
MQAKSSAQWCQAVSKGSKCRLLAHRLHLTRMIARKSRWPWS